MTKQPDESSLGSDPVSNSIVSNVGRESPAALPSSHPAFGVFETSVQKQVAPALRSAAAAG
jgi:hypothetical protein